MLIFVTIWLYLYNIIIKVKFIYCYMYWISFIYFDWFIVRVEVDVSLDFVVFVVIGGYFIFLGMGKVFWGIYYYRIIFRVDWCRIGGI